MRDIGVYKIFISDDSKCAYDFYNKFEILLILRYFYKPWFIKKIVLLAVSAGSVLLSFIKEDLIYSFISLCTLLLFKFLLERRFDI